MSKGFRQFEIKRGSRGFMVAAVQRALNALVPATDDRAASRLKVDGVCGPATMSALQKRTGKDATVFDIRCLGSWAPRVCNTIDISGHNEGGGKRLINFDKVREAGTDRVIIKLTENAGYVNEEAFRQVRAAFGAELAVDLYHFIKVGPTRDLYNLAAAEADAYAEVAHFLRTFSRVGYMRRAFGRVFVDIEHGVNETRSKLEDQYNARVYATVIRLLRAAGWDVGVYTAEWAEDAYFQQGHPQDLEVIASCPLWVASYNGGGYPNRVPDLWSDLDIAIWQYGNDGQIDGIDGNVDLNVELIEL